MSRRLVPVKRNSARSILLFCALLLIFSVAVPKAASARAPILLSVLPLVSLTFDDGDQSIIDAGFPILDAQGIPGTLYLIASDLPPSWNAQLKTLENHGWEIGSHSVNHEHMETLSPEDQIYELSQSKAVLQAMGLSITGFAYPFGTGHSDPEIRARVAEYYSYARSVSAGYNSQSLNPYDLYSMPQSVSDPIETMKGWVDAAIASNRWLIICMHTVDDTGDPYSISPDTLTELASYIKSKVDAGAMRAVTVRDGLGMYGTPLPGPAITNVSAVPGNNQAAITWTTDVLSSSIVDYGETASYSITTPETNTAPRVTSHSVTITGLTSCTTYYYRVRSRDADNNEGVRMDQAAFTTTGCDGTPPVITNVSADPGDNQAVITWNTNEASTSRVNYGLTAAYGFSTLERDIAPRVTSHSVTITGLSRCTLYHYKVRSKDAGMVEGASSDITFMTTNCDFTPPEITSMSATPYPNEAIIAWTTDEASTSMVEYGLASWYGLLTPVVDTLPTVTDHTIILSNLAECTLYYYRVHSVDASGNLGISAGGTFMTTNCDEIPPVITPVSIITSTTNIVINLTTDENAFASVEYGPTSGYGFWTPWTGGSQPVKEHYLTLPNTTACTQYHYRIRAKDARQNEAVSQDYTVTTSCYNVFLSALSRK